MQQGTSFNIRYGQKTKIFFWIITVVCLIYAISNVHLTDMWTALRHYSPLYIFLLLLLEVLLCIVNGYRKYVLFSGRLSFKHSIQASFLGLGGNNIFPAKAGEIIHTLYIAKVTNIPITEVIPTIFLERFADINVLVVCIICMLSLFEPPQWTIGIIGSGLLAVWLGMFLLYYKPSWIFSLLSYIPWKYPRTIAKNICTALHTKLTFPWILRLIVTTLLTWFITIGFFIFSFSVVASLPLSFIQSTCAAFLLCFTAILPSSPGSLGLYEASSVFVLGLFGINKSEALTIGIVCHAIVFFVPVIGMGISLYIDKQAKSIVMTAEKEIIQP